MHRVRARPAASLVVAALTLLLGLTTAAPAQARDGAVTSFDGTRIVFSFFAADGLRAGERAPTVLNGPGYSSGRAAASDATVTALRAAGYNVVTFDPRGFGMSGGSVELDSPDFEGRDAQALIDMIAAQPEARLDAPGDPRVGFLGASYGGGIQNSTAAIDPRVDAITPQIAWHSLVSSLDKSDTAKGGWGALLFGIGTQGSTLPGLASGSFPSPFGGRQDPAITRALAEGAATGRFSDASKAFFAARGVGDRISSVRVPTLITQGTDDTLFTLHEAIENYRAQRAAGATVSMIWFCGGLTDPSIAHGICLDSRGPDPSIVLHQSILWLDRYLKGDTTVRTGPGFRWVSDVGTLHGADSYPPPTGSPVTGSGAGTLTLIPGSTSGLLIAATSAVNALNVPLSVPPAGTQLLGEPTLRLAYRGTAPSSDARVYAHLISNRTGRPLGNQVTPIPLVLDGTARTTTIPLEAVAADAVEGSTYTLQLTDGSDVYFAARQPGAVAFSAIDVSVPTVAPGASQVLDATAGSTPGSGASTTSPATTSSSPSPSPSTSATGAAAAAAASSAAAPATALAPGGPARCADPAPTSRFASRGGVRLRERRLLLRGTASDVGCRAGLRAVYVSIARTTGSKCRYVRSDGRLASAATSCRRTRYVRVRGTTPWTYRSPRRLPVGRYKVWLRAVDEGANVERKTRPRLFRRVGR